jgi:germacradienol/geosmin synthase
VPLGMSAASILGSYVRTMPQRLSQFTSTPKVVEPYVLPSFDVPFPLALSPHLDRARDEVAHWAVEQGFTGEGVWDEHKLRGFDFPLCSAGIDPDATAQELFLSGCWLTWGTYADDVYPLWYGRTRDLAGVKAQTARLKECMPLDLVQTVVPANANERALADLWQRTAAPMTPSFRATFRETVDAMLDAWVWEVVNMHHNRIPDPVDYVEMRRSTFGSEMTTSLSRLSHSATVPPELWGTRVVQTMERSAMDYCTMLNDVFSYTKETQFEGEVHNIVRVIENFLGVPQARAFDITYALMNARLDQFVRSVETDLPRMFDDLSLTAGARAGLTRYADELKDWIAGIIHWHEQTSRYDEIGAFPVFHRGPSGLGTSASRLTSRASS